MVELNVKVNRDLKNIIDNLRHARLKGFPSAAGRGLLASARVVENKARHLAPVGPTRKVKGRTVKGGRLRRSIRSRRLPTRDKVVRAAVIAGGRFGVDYASFVEFQQPYLRPAYYSTQVEQALAFRGEFERVILQRISRRRNS